MGGRFVFEILRIDVFLDCGGQILENLEVRFVRFVDSIFLDFGDYVFVIWGSDFEYFG